MVEHEPEYHFEEEELPVAASVILTEIEVPVMKRQVFRRHERVKHRHIVPAADEEPPQDSEPANGQPPVEEVTIPPDIEEHVAHEEPMDVLETEFRPVIREKSPVVRTAVRKGQETVSKREVYRKRETETQRLPSDEIQDEQILPARPTEIVVEEEIILEPSVTTEVENEPDFVFDAPDEETSFQLAEPVPVPAGIETEEEGELQWKPEIKEQRHITRTAYRHDEDVVTKRQVIRTRSTEVHKILEFEKRRHKHRLERAESPKEEPESDVVAEPVATEELEDEPDFQFDEDTVDEKEERDTQPKVRRTVVRQAEEPVTRRQVIRRRVKESYTSTERLDLDDDEEQQRPVVEEDEVLPEPAIAAEVETEPDYQFDLPEEELVNGVVEEVPVKKEPEMMRTVLRQIEMPVTRRQVFRRRVQESYVQTEHRDVIDQEEPEDHDIIPEPLVDTDVENEPEYDFNLPDEELVNGLVEEDETKLNMKRTVMRQEEIPVTRRQVFRKQVIESHVRTDHYESGSSEESRESTPTGEEIQNGLPEHNDIDDNGAVDDFIVEETELPRKFDYLRTALRQEEYPVTRRQVYRQRVQEARPIEIETEKNVRNIQKEPRRQHGEQIMIDGRGYF